MAHAGSPLTPGNPKADHPAYARRKEKRACKLEVGETIGEVQSILLCVMSHKTTELVDNI